jgi:hypothetical protein
MRTHGSLGNLGTSRPEQKRREGEEGGARSLRSSSLGKALGPEHETRFTQLTATVAFVGTVFALSACFGGSSNISDPSAGTLVDAGQSLDGQAENDGSGTPDAGIADAVRPDDTPKDSDLGRTGPTDVLLVGGFDGQNRLNDAWTWDGNGWKTAAPVPGARENHATATLAGDVVLFGGYTNALPPFLGDTWLWKSGAWSGGPPTGPGARSDHAMVPFAGEVLLFGGYDGTWRNDTWSWNGSTWASKNVAGPPPRSVHAMAPLGNSIVLFGGYGGTKDLNDTWVWNGGSWVQANVSGPPARSDHTMVTLNGKVVLFGGSTGSLNYGDTWEWDGSAWTQRNVIGPSPRTAHAMTTFGNKVVLFGGVGVSGNLSDTWEWDGNAWTQRNAPGPTARRSHALVTR